MRLRSTIFSLVLLTAVLVATAVAQADSVTWVEGADGNDANACTRVSPCKTFAGAQNHTDAGGTIRVLTPGAYGQITVTKSLTIDAGAQYAGVLASSGFNGIVVDAPGADVVLRNLSIEAIAPCTTPGTANGIKFISGRSLHVEYTTIRGFSGRAIDMEPAAGGSASVSRTDLHDNCTGGVFAASAADTNLTLTDSFITHSGTAVGVGDGGRAEIARNLVTGNTTGLAATGSGVLASWGNNRVGGNGSDGAPTQTLGSGSPPPPGNTSSTSSSSASPSSTSSPGGGSVSGGPTAPIGPVQVVTLCHVPRLLSKTMSQAGAALATAHCRLGKVTYRVKRGKRRNRIYVQSPGSGWSSAAGAKVNVTLNAHRPRRRSKARAAIAAGPSRTWISGVGSDLNPCSRTAPCRTFAGAQTRTLNGGTISLVDSGDFGALTVSQPLTIDGGGNSAVISVGAGASAISVNAGAGHDVALRNLSLINSAGCAAAGSGSGISFVSGGALHIANVNASGFAGSGIALSPTATGPVDIHGGSLTDNCTAGISAQMPGGDVEVAAAGVTVSHDGTGILAGDGALVRMTGNTVTGNDTGLATSGSGSIASWGDDSLSGNGSDGVSPLVLATI